MKAFLLAAGNGTRLRPLTNQIPKCLVPIRGTPLLRIWLDWCSLYGISEVLVNLHAHSEKVRDYLRDYEGQVQVTVTHESKLLGSAGTVHSNRDFVSGEKDFAILYADVLTNCRFDKLLEFHRSRNSSATLGTYRVPNPQECGIILTDETGFVREFTEKPAVPKSDQAFTGIMVGGPELMEQVPRRDFADIGFDVLPKLLGKMYAQPIEDFVLDIGTMEKYQRAQLEWPGLG